MLPFLGLPLPTPAQPSDPGSELAKSPFLSIDPSQLDSLWTAFRVQWTLFSGFTDGSQQILYYAALAAVLVGALAIVFNKSAHDFKTIGPWLLVAIICLFAQIHSKLLFYPLNQAGVSQTTVDDAKANTNGFRDPYGFTPQLVAAHIGTTLQIIFIDLFKNLGANSVVDGSTAEAGMASMPAFNAGDSWLGQARALDQQCRSLAIAPAALAQMTPAAGGTPNATSPPSATSAAASRDEPYTLRTALQDITNYYTRSGVDFKKPPPSIIIPETAPTDSTQRAAHDTLVLALYNHLNNKAETTATPTMAGDILRQAAEYNARPDASASSGRRLLGKFRVVGGSLAR